MDWGHSQVLADVVDCCGMSHVRPIQLLRGCHIVERVVPVGVAGLNMKISGIVQHQQNLPVLGAGLGAFSIQGYRKFLTGVPGSIHAHLHRFICHFHKVGNRSQLSQRHQLIQTIQQFSSFCGRFSRFIFLGKLLKPVPNIAAIPAAVPRQQSGQCRAPCKFPCSGARCR